MTALAYRVYTQSTRQGSCVLQCNMQYELLVSLRRDIRKGKEDTGSTSGGGE